MPLELFIYFLLPGGAEESACSVYGPLDGPRSLVSWPCSSSGTPPQCQPCRRWGRHPRSIWRSPHSLAKEALGTSPGLREGVSGEEEVRWRKQKGDQVFLKHTYMHTEGWHTGKHRCSGDDSCVNAITTSKRIKQEKKKDVFCLFCLC